jgi:fucose 4-O-acetylase-like acetyltransferase
VRLNDEGKNQIDGSGVVLDIGHGGSDGKTVSAAHGFLGTRQNASVPTVPGGIWGMSDQKSERRRSNGPMSAQHVFRASAAANRGERIGYFDVAKGISIALVALFHTTGGFVSANIISNVSLLNFMTTLAYGFHVHIFFAVSGYFSVKALTRVNFLRDRMLALYYPYLLWSVISLLASSVAASATNNHYSWSTLLTLPIWPILHYWFLLSLMVSHLLLYIFRTQRALIVSAVVALVASVFLPGWLHDAAYFYPFTVTGALFALRGSLPALRPWIAVLCFMFLIAGTYLATTIGISASDIRIAPFILFSFAGCYALVCFSETVVRSWVGRVFAYLGKHSLAIYLMHVLIAASLRIFLYKIDPSFNPIAGMTACFVASIGLPLMANEIARRFGLLKFAGFEPLLSDRQLALKTSLTLTGNPP